MQTHLTVSLQSHLLGLLGLRWRHWVHIAVQDLDLVLHVSVQREWQTALQERLCKGAAVCVERRAFDVGFGTSFQLCQGDVETLDHIVSAQIENFWITATLLLGVGVDATVVLERANPVGRDPVALLALGA